MKDKKEVVISDKVCDIRTKKKPRGKKKPEVPKVIRDSWNKEKPSQKDLDEWGRGTCYNNHTEVALGIARWAENYSRTFGGLLGVFSAVRKELVEVKGQQDIDQCLTFENGQKRTRLIEVLFAAIKSEFGDDTYDAINAVC